MRHLLCGKRGINKGTEFSLSEAAELTLYPNKFRLHRKFPD